MNAKVIIGAVCVGLAASAWAELISLESEYATCTVETRGARIMSFKPKGGEEVIWNANPVQLEAPKWAHGGIPTCWPWFGVNGKVDIHGTAWKRDFTVVSKREKGQRAELVLSLQDTRARLEYTVKLYDTLILEMKTVNTSKAPFSFCAAFHPYFRVGEVTKTSVGGVNPSFAPSAVTKPVSMGRPIDDVFPAGPGSCTVYRLADPVLDRTIYVFAENSTLVNLWNPGAEKNTPGFIPGDSWRTFACVEPVQGSIEAPITLNPGDYTMLRMGVDVRKGSKTSGYIAKDPRRPSAADEPTGRPFHVLYLGAHPDDIDYDYAAQVVKMIRAGAKVTAVTLTSGSRGHVEMMPEELAARRFRESQAAARIYGFERYIVSECPDCELEATRGWRERIGRLIRDVAPDMVITHRTVDYHADHRAVGQIVQDCTYFLGVPHWCIDTPVPENLPFVMYAVDGFTVPRKLRPDLVMSGEGAIDVAARGLACHASQLFEWMPPEEGLDPATLNTDEKRSAYALAKIKGVYRYYGSRYPGLVRQLYGREDEPVSFAELSEYSRPASAREIRFLTSIPGFKWLLNAKIGDR